jgi:hypothetical protein
MMTAPNPLLPVADSSGELDKRQGGCEGGGRGLIPGLLARTRGEGEEHSAASSCPNRGRNGGPVHDSRVEDREKGENPTAWAQPVEEGGSGRPAEARRRAVSGRQRQSSTGWKRGSVGRPGEEGKMGPTQEHSANFHLFQIFQLIQN